MKWPLISITISSLNLIVDNFCQKLKILKQYVPIFSLTLQMFFTRWQQNFTSIDTYTCTLFWKVIENNDIGRMRVLHFELSFELLISRIKTI